jgi:hypothetical protein
MATVEKVIIKVGPEFGENAENILIVDKGLYGLVESSTPQLYEHLAVKLWKMGFKSLATDLDLWYWKVDNYYGYIPTYIDDLFTFSKDPMKLIEDIKKDYVWNGVGIHKHYYLGGNTDEV